MNADHEEFVKEATAALPRFRGAELTTDLWPRMLRRLGEAPPSFGWFEMLLAALVALVFAVYPELIPLVFDQL